jgi:hypothetical protein
MKTSRRYSAVILVAAVIAGSALLVQHNGFFKGAFRTEILASVKAEDVFDPTGIATASGTTAAEAVDKQQTAALH